MPGSWLSCGKNVLSYFLFYFRIYIIADWYDGLYESWYHIDCLFDGAGVNETPNCLDDIEGIQRIRYADQALNITKINETPIDFGSPTKRASFNKSNELDSDIRPCIAQQNKLYYRIYDAMNKKTSAIPERQKKEMLIEILKLNKQAIPLRKRFSTQDVSSNIKRLFIGKPSYVC